MSLIGFGDIERWLIIILIGLSLWFLWRNYRNEAYTRQTKLLLTIPRAYIMLYYFLVITDVYTLNESINSLARTGIGSVYGLLLLFSVEAYVRWANRKYGRG
jgi:hypothetical protein